MSKLLFKKRFTEKRQFLTFWGFHRDNAKADHSDAAKDVATGIQSPKMTQILNFEPLPTP